MSKHIYLQSHQDSSLGLLEMQILFICLCLWHTVLTGTAAQLQAGDNAL